MASAGGLTRRRGGAAVNEDGEESPTSRVASPTPKQQTPSFNDRRPETNYSSGENGHKIAFDKQVRLHKRDNGETVGSDESSNRDISHFGMTTYRTHYEDAS